MYVQSKCGPEFDGIQTDRIWCLWEKIEQMEQLLFIIQTERSLTWWTTDTVPENVTESSISSYDHTIIICVHNIRMLNWCIYPPGKCQVSLFHG